MKYWYQRPHELISEYVRTVLILEGSSPSATSGLPLVTNGMQALLCCTEKESTGVVRITHLTLYGKSIPSECWEVDSNKTVIAFFFMPFAMAGIFNIPAAKVLDGPVDLHNWIPHKANALRTQLMYAESTAQKVEALENLLIHQFQENRKVCEIIRSATDEIMYHPNTAILSVLLQKLNLTERTFQRIFKKYVGVPPNQYRRICQFQLSFAQVRAKEFNTLTDVAYDSGFADQSHFIRSFKEFADTTPNHYLLSGLKEKT
jgi:AraC-like DNA-binding protein